MLRKTKRNAISDDNSDSACIESCFRIAKRIVRIFSIDGKSLVLDLIQAAFSSSIIPLLLIKVLPGT